MSSIKLSSSSTIFTSSFIQIKISSNTSKKIADEIESLKLKSKQNNYQNLAIDMIKIGELFVNETLYHEAITWYKEALCIEEIYYPDDIVRISDIMYRLGDAYLHLNDYNNALDNFLEARSILFISNPYHDLRDAEILFKIGIVYQRKGLDQEAYEAFEKGIHIHENYFSDVNATHNSAYVENRTQLLIHRGELYEKWGHYRQGLNDYQQCYSILDDYSCVLSDQRKSNMSMKSDPIFTCLALEDIDVMLADIEYHINHLESLLQLRSECVNRLSKYISEREKESNFDICHYSRREKIEAAKYVIQYINTHPILSIGEIINHSEFLKHKGPLTNSRLGQIFQTILTLAQRCRRQLA